MKISTKKTEIMIYSKYFENIIKMNDDALKEIPKFKKTQAVKLQKLGKKEDTIQRIKEAKVIVTPCITQSHLIGTPTNAHTYIFINENI